MRPFCGRDSMASSRKFKQTVEADRIGDEGVLVSEDQPALYMWDSEARE